MAERIQLRRTKGWRKPEGAIVVARPSKWGNPYRIASYAAWQEAGVGDLSITPSYWSDGRMNTDARADVVEKYRRWIGSFRCHYQGCHPHGPIKPLRAWTNPTGWGGSPGIYAYFKAPFSVREIRSELAGHDLCCWCPLDQPCHADVLLEIANPGEARRHCA